MSPNIPTDKEFEIIINALAAYTVAWQNKKMLEEILPAFNKTDGKPKSDNELAFEQAFNPDKFIEEFKSNVNIERCKQLASDAYDEITILSSKMIQLRRQINQSSTEAEIENLLK